MHILHEYLTGEYARKFDLKDLHMRQSWMLLNYLSYFKIHS